LRLASEKIAHSEMPISTKVYPESLFLVKKSNIPNAGKGLFTTVDLPKNSRVLIYQGEMMLQNDGHADKIDKKTKTPDDHSYCWFLNGKEEICINSIHTPQFKARYVNDAYKTKFKNNLRPSFDYKNKRVSYISIKNIKAGDELFISYGEPYWDSRS